MQEPTRIIAVRHGETDWNVAGRIQGDVDQPLNARGRWQAERVAAALAGEAISVVYTSDLQRARATAEAIAAVSGAPLSVMRALRERSFGVIEGQTFTEFEQTDPDEARRWRQRDPEFAPQGGETLMTLRDRVCGAVNALAAQHPGEQVAVVAHGGVLDILYRAATGLELQAPRTWHIGNAAVNRLLWTPDSGMTMVVWGDDNHLEDEPLDETSL